jgi:hypothetical protein
MTESMSPLKLYDYLASGKPIVTTPVSQAKDFAQLVMVAENRERFEDYILRGFSESPDDPLRSRRKQAGKNNSWESRYQQIAAAMNRNGICP